MSDLTAHERACDYLAKRLGGRKGFDLYAFCDGDECLMAEVVDELARDFAAAARAAGLVQCTPDRAGWWWFTGYDLYGERELDRPVEVHVGAVPVLYAVTAGEGCARSFEELEGEWRWLGEAS